MKILLLLLLVFALPAWPVEDEADLVQRARIAAERKQVDAAFQGEERACYGKFAVNDCLNDARGRRRAALADLRRQEISLNDAQRKRRAAERLRSIEERVREQPGGAADRATAAEGQRSRSARAAGKAAARVSDEVSRPAKAAAREEQARRRQAQAGEGRAQRDMDAAKNVKRQEKRRADAEKRKARLEERQAGSTKPDARPLPAGP